MNQPGKSSNRVRKIRTFHEKMKKIVEVTFKSVPDFRHRIIALWQGQKEDEEYKFIFLCPEAEREFDKLNSSFQSDMIENPRS